MQTSFVKNQAVTVFLIVLLAAFTPMQAVLALSSGRVAMQTASAASPSFSEYLSGVKSSFGLPESWDFEVAQPGATSEFWKLYQQYYPDAAVSEQAPQPVASPAPAPSAGTNLAPSQPLRAVVAPRQIPRIVSPEEQIAAMGYVQGEDGRYFSPDKESQMGLDEISVKSAADQLRDAGFVVLPTNKGLVPALNAQHGTNFKDAEEYYKWIYGGGQKIIDPTYEELGELFQIPDGGNADQYVNTPLGYESGGGGLFGGSFLSTVLTVVGIGLAIVGIPEVAVTLSEATASFAAAAKTTMSVVGIVSSVASGQVGIGTFLGAAGFTDIPPTFIQAAGIVRDVVTDNVSPMTFLGPVTGAIARVTGVPPLGTFDYDLTPIPETIADAAEQSAVADTGTDQGGGTGYPTSQEQADQNVEVTPLGDAEDIFGTWLDSEDSGQTVADAGQRVITDIYGQELSEDALAEAEDLYTTGSVGKDGVRELTRDEFAKMEAACGDPKTADGTCDVAFRNYIGAGQRIVARVTEAVLPKGVTLKQELDVDGLVIRNTFIDQKTGKVFLSHQAGESPVLYTGDGTPIQTSGGYIQGLMRNAEDNTGLPLFSSSFTNAIQTTLDTPGKIDVFMQTFLCDGRPADSCSFLRVRGENPQTLYTYGFRATNGYVVLTMADGSTKVVSGQEFSDMNKSSSVSGVLIKYPNGNTGILSDTVYKAIRDQWWKVSGLEEMSNSIKKLTGDALIPTAPSALPNDPSGFYGKDFRLYSPPSTSNAIQLLQDIKTQASQLPPEYWNSLQITPRTLGVYSSLDLTSTGVGSTDKNSIWLNSNSSGDYTSTINRLTFAHELSHAFFEDFHPNSSISRLEYQFAYAVYGDEWQSVYGGTSGSQAILAAKSGNNWRMANYRPDGFVRAYAYKGGPVEDMAVTAEQMFANYPAFKEAAKDDLTLATKGRIIRELYAQKVPAMDDAYWENLKPIDQSFGLLPRLSDGKGGFVKTADLGDYLNQNSNVALSTTEQVFANVIEFPPNGIPPPVPPVTTSLFDPLPASDTPEQSSWWKALTDKLFGETEPTTDTSSIIKTDFKKVPPEELAGETFNLETTNAFGNAPTEAQVFYSLEDNDAVEAGEIHVPPGIEAKWKQGDFPKPAYLAFGQARYFWNLWGPPGSPANGSNPPSWWAEYGTTFFPPTSSYSIFLANPNLLDRPNCDESSSRCGIYDPNYRNLLYHVPPNKDAELTSDRGLVRGEMSHQTPEETFAIYNQYQPDKSGVVIIDQTTAINLLFSYGSPNRCTQACPWWWSSGQFVINVSSDMLIEQLPLQQTSYGDVSDSSLAIGVLQSMVPTPTEMVMRPLAQLGGRTYDYVSDLAADIKRGLAADTLPASEVLPSGILSDTSKSCAAAYNTPCESTAVNSCGQRGTGVYNCSGICQALPPPDSRCPLSTTCQDPVATNFRGPLPCEFPAIMVTEHLRVSPLLLRSVETASISWEVSNALTCSVTGTNGDGTGANPTGRWNTLSSGTAGKTSSRIQGQTTYTLLCASLPGATPSSFSESQTINIIPSYRE